MEETETTTQEPTNLKEIYGFTIPTNLPAKYGDRFARSYDFWQRYKLAGYIVGLLYIIGALFCFSTPGIIALGYIIAVIATLTLLFGIVGGIWSRIIRTQSLAYLKPFIKENKIKAYEGESIAQNFFTRRQGITSLISIVLNKRPSTIRLDYQGKTSRYSINPKTVNGKVWLDFAPIPEKYPQLAHVSNKDSGSGSNGLDKLEVVASIANAATYIALN